MSLHVLVLKNDIVCNAARSIAHCIICTVRLFPGKMHSDWFNGIEILQGRWQHGEKVGYCYPSGLEKRLVTKGLKICSDFACYSIQLKIKDYSFQLKIKD